MRSDNVDIDVKRAIRWLIASAVVVSVCGALAIVLPVAFPSAIAALLGWLFVVAAIAHLAFGIHFGRGTFAWHAFIAALYCLAALSFVGNPLLGIVLLSLVVGVVLVAEGIIQIVLFFVLRRQRHAVWVLIDGIITLGLGIVACAHWPPAAPEIIPYLVGISFISSGVSRLVLAFAIDIVEPNNHAS
jgi:uncharacterized membrane protein HdeD (DUF308 family)